MQNVVALLIELDFPSSFYFYPKIIALSLIEFLEQAPPRQPLAVCVYIYIYIYIIYIYIYCLLVDVYGWMDRLELVSLRFTSMLDRMSGWLNM